MSNPSYNLAECPQTTLRHEGRFYIPPSINQMYLQRLRSKERNFLITLFPSEGKFPDRGEEELYRINRECILVCVNGRIRLPDQGLMPNPLPRHLDEEVP